MKRKLTAFTTSLVLLLSALIVANVGAHTVTVGDSYRGDWFAKTPSAKNMGTVARDTANRGEFVWLDMKGDQLVVPGFTGNITRETDLEQFNVTADANNIYFLAKMEYIQGLNLSRAPEVMISIDTDHAAGPNIQLPASAGISVTAEAAWEYVIQTKFTTGAGGATANPKIWKPAESTCNSCTAELVASTSPNPGSFIEIKVPWSNFAGGKPSVDKFWRFTVSTYYDNFAKPTPPAPSAAIDVLSTKTTAAEVADGTIDTYADVRFDDASGEVFSPVLISEFLPYPQYGGPGVDPAGEWIELYNALPASCGAACNVNLQDYKLGNQPYRGTSSGAMLKLPNHTLAPGDFAVVVNDAGGLSRFTTQYPTVPNSKIIRLSTMQPYVPTYTGTQWAPGTTLSLSRRKSTGGVLSDFKETVALIDEADTITDLVQYGTAGMTGYDKNNKPITVALTGVTANTSFERCPTGRDTNDASFDFTTHDPASGNNPTPAAPCPASAGINLQITKNATTPEVTPNGTVSYILTWDNIGQTGVTNVVVTDTLPAEIAFLSADPPQSSVTGQQVTWNLGPAAPGASGTITLMGTLSGSVAGGRTFVNHAGIKSANPADVDSAPGDNVAEASITAIIPDLRVSSTDWPGTTNPGDTFCYDINYAYEFGNTDATNVVITDQLPSGLSLVSQESSPSLPFNGATRGTLVWGPATVPVDGTGTISVCVKVDANVTSGAGGQNVITITGTPDSDTSPGSNNVESKPLTIGNHLLYLPLMMK